MTINVYDSLLRKLICWLSSDFILRNRTVRFFFEEKMNYKLQIWKHQSSPRIIRNLLVTHLWNWSPNIFSVSSGPSWYRWSCMQLAAAVNLFDVKFFGRCSPARNISLNTNMFVSSFQENVFLFSFASFSLAPAFMTVEFKIWWISSSSVFGSFSGDYYWPNSINIIWQFIPIYFI